MVNGLVGLIPVVDQILDVRDVAACLFHCCRTHYETGGVDSQRWHNLALAGLGVVPEVGSLAKMVLKPALKSARQGQLAGLGAKFVSATLGEASMISKLFKGQGGSAIKYWRDFPWNKHWSAANKRIDDAYERSLKLLRGLQEPQRFLPARHQEKLLRIAMEWERRMPRVYAGMRNGLLEARGVLEDLVTDTMGEYAHAMEMATAGVNALPFRPKSKQRYLMNRDRADTGGGTPSSTPHKDVGPEKKQQAGQPQADPVDKRQQATARFAQLGLELIGVAGEHIADYYCAENLAWGADWDKHDAGHSGSWKNKAEPAKLSHEGKLYMLSRNPNPKGIDSVWLASANNEGKPYAIVEAKASRDEDGPKFAQNPDSTRQPSINQKLDDNSDAKKNAGAKGPKGKGKGAGKQGGADDASSPDAADVELHKHPELLLEPLDEEEDPADKKLKKAGGGKPPKGSAPPSSKPGKTDGKTATKNSGEPQQDKGEVLVQMSEEWIAKNIKIAVSIEHWRPIVDRGRAIYSRHLFFSPLYHPSQSPAAHAQAMTALVAGTPFKPDHHGAHDCYHYDEEEVKAAVNKRKKKLRKDFPRVSTLKHER